MSDSRDGGVRLAGRSGFDSHSPGTRTCVDLNFLRDLATDPGPFATVYLDVSHDTEDAAHALELRWAGVRHELEGQGADGETLAALDRAFAQAPPAVGRAGRVLVAAHGEVLLDRLLPDPPASPIATWGPVPDLLPMLRDQPEPLPTVVVRVDKAGGEIYLAGPGSTPEQVADVRGTDHPLHKVRGGGWAHLNMQERVEEVWRRNVGEVADRVDRLVSTSGARLLVLAGETQSRARLFDALGERSAGIAVQVEHTGGPEIGLDDLTAAVDEATRDAVAAERAALRERFEQAAGRPEGLAVDGLGGVLAALRAEQVDTLLLDGAAVRDRTVWIGKAPSEVAADADELRALGGAPTARVPADAALLRAAAGTGAAFAPLDGEGITDGVAALLRYPLATSG
jgi:hypothetical protein